MGKREYFNLSFIQYCLHRENTYEQIPSSVHRPVYKLIFGVNILHVNKFQHIRLCIVVCSIYELSKTFTSSSSTNKFGNLETSSSPSIFLHNKNLLIILFDFQIITNNAVCEKYSGENSNSLTPLQTSFIDHLHVMYIWVVCCGIKLNKIPTWWRPDVTDAP